MRSILVLSIVATIGAVDRPALAAVGSDFPARPVRLIMPTAPGGATDTAGRVLAESMSATLGRQVVVDNRPGASTTLGARLVAQSPADGYTVLFGVAANLALAPQLAPSGYDPLTAFTAIGLIQRGPYVLSITRGLEIANVKQLIDYARANPGKLAYATPGVGSAQHLAWEMLASRTGTRFLHVPGGKMLIDTIAGRIPLLLDSPSPTLIQSAEAGKLRFIALSGARRLEQLPHVPTFIEQGLAGFEAYSWWGLVAPANTPGSAIAKLNAALNTALESRHVKERFAAAGVPDERFASTPAKFDEWIRSEHARYARVIRDSNIRVD